MAPRLELQELLEELLGSSNVYFQPPANVVMNFPAIVYKRDMVETYYADDIPFCRKTRYQVTVIDRNLDSDIPDQVAQLPTAAHDRTFVVDNLNHDVYNLYF